MDLVLVMRADDRAKAGLAATTVLHQPDGDIYIREVSAREMAQGKALIITKADFDRMVASAIGAEVKPDG